MENIDKSKGCQCCGIKEFIKSRDAINHFKSNKHIKKTLELDYSKCPYCEYLSDDKSNMNKHLLSVHEYESEKVEKQIEKKIKEVKIKESKLSKIIIKQYYTLKEAEKTLRMVLLGKNSRLKNLKNRMYKDDEEEVVQTKKDIIKARENYDNNIQLIKDMETKYPDLVELPPPPPDEKSIKESKKLDEEEKKEEEEVKIESDKQKIRQQKMDDIYKQIEENRQLYITSKGDKKYKEKTIELEKELKAL
jgi:hypothetical protein